jgi:hypothetical protein
MAGEAGVNAKYLEKMARKDWFKNVQAPYYEQPAEFVNAKVKSHYTRYFEATSTNTHFIENACAFLRSPLVKPEHIEMLEQKIEQNIKKVVEEIEGDITRAHQLMQANAVELDAKFFQDPLKVHAKILSPICFQYLDALQKADHLILCLESLRLRGIIKRGDCDKQVARIDHVLKSIQRCAFELALGLRTRAKTGELQADQAMPAVTEGAAPAAPLVSSPHSGARRKRPNGSTQVTEVAT